MPGVVPAGSPDVGKPLPRGTRQNVGALHPVSGEDRIGSIMYENLN